MNSNVNEESRNRRREEALARRLGEVLDQAAPPGAHLCPDAELIAAYHERALAPEEIAQYEVHFAACSRCRKILAVLAAADDAPLSEKEVARLGELVAAARAPLEAASQPGMPVRPKLLRRRTRWLAPALGVAAVLTVWFAIKPPWRVTNQGSTGTLIAQARKSEPLPSAVAPTPNQISDAAPMDKTESAQPSARAFAKDVLNERGTMNRPAPKNNIAESAQAGEEKGQAEVSDSMPAASAGSPAPASPLRMPPMQAQPSAAGQGRSPAPEAPASTSQSVTVTGEAPPVNSSSGSLGGLVNQNRIAQLPLNGRNYTDLSTLKGTGENTILIRGQSSTVLWRAGKDGLIERSTDAGKSWHTQTSPLKDDWLAGAAVSDTVCWLAGRNGAIVQTTNGKRWKRITPPAEAAASGKLPDWIDVTASSAQIATLTASDQRHYLTQNGGKTWQAQ